MGRRRRRAAGPCDGTPELAPQPLDVRRREEEGKTGADLDPRYSRSSAIGGESAGKKQRRARKRASGAGGLGRRALKGLRAREWPNFRRNEGRGRGRTRMASAVR